MSEVAERLFAEIRKLAPQIAACAEEMEAARCFPRALIDEFKRIGVIRAFTPKSHGGLELDLPDALNVITEAAKLDGSAGWIAMIAGPNAVLFSRLPRHLFDKIYSAGPDVIQAGLVRAAGTAEIVEGGYRVSGRWPFASGCQNADWILGGVKIVKNGRPVEGPIKGLGLERIITLPASQFRIEDTWKVSGLRGTGSHHTVLENAFVPEDHCFDFAGPSAIPGPLYETIGPFIPLCNASVVIGIAESAISDIAALAGSGKTPYRTRTMLRDSQLFQFEIGKLEAEFRAARAYYDSQIAKYHRRALVHTANDPALFNDNMQMQVWVTAACARVVDQCYLLGGGSSLYESSPLQRRLRDIHAATQHVVPQQRHYVVSGQQRLGLPAIPLSA